MGCAPSSKKKITHRNGTLVPSLIILPGTFIKINEKDFYEVYSKGLKLGTGAYAEVWICTHKKHDVNRAVKIIDKHMLYTEEIRSQFIQEIEILKILDHPNIVRAFEFFEDKSNFYIVMEHCRGGELFYEIIKYQQFSEHQAAQVMKQVFSCIAYLHSIGVVHRDIKPENLLLEEKDDFFNIKLIDFGVAVKKTSEDIKGLIGTPTYIAPEVLDGGYNEKCDVWSAGVLMYILLSGCPPFQNENPENLFENIRECNYVINGNEWDDISEDAKDLLKKILTPQRSRISASKSLQHRWFASQLKNEKASNEVLKPVLDKLVNFNSENKLEEATKLFIITQLMSNNEIKEARDIFKQLDENGDGKLSRQELIKGYKRFVPSKTAVTLVDKIMVEVDTDNSGFIDYNEFLKAAVDVKSLASPEYLQAAFNVFDRDGSGKISLDEIKVVLGQNTNREVFEEILEKVDQNGDGEIDIDEFTALVKNIKTAIS